MKKLIALLFFPIILFLVIVFSFNQLNNQKNKNVSNDSAISKEDKSASNKNNQISLIPSQSEVRRDINLVISEPNSGSVTNLNTITVRGSTEPKTNVIVNDNEITSDTNGMFQASVSLDEGENYIYVVAYNDAGTVAEREILITKEVNGL